MAEVAGAWTGFAGANEFVRLELDASGSGFLCISYLPDNPPRLYLIEKWRLAGHLIQLRTRPLDGDAEPVGFRQLTYSWISLEGKLFGRRWERDVRLYSEREWRKRATPLRERIARYRKQHGR